jgi:hypothetical protein
MDSRGASADLVDDPRGQCELLAERGGIAVPHIVEAREHTRERLAGLLSAFRGEDLAEGLSVCVFGSWAREELTPGSDDEWAVLAEGVPVGGPELMRGLVGVGCSLSVCTRWV